MYEKFEAWFARLEEPQIKTMAIREFKSKANDLEQSQLTSMLFNEIKDIYEKTISYRNKRLALEDKITCFYFNGSVENHE